MTIIKDMDYEKKYNAALDAARHIYDDMKFGENFSGMEDLEVIFPELRESEDERIYNEIMEFFKMNEKRCIVDNSYTKWIAWLEKQKELKIPEEKFKHPLYVEGFEAGKQVGAQYEAVFGKQEELPFVKDVVLGLPGLYLYDGERMHFQCPVTEENPYDFAMSQQEEKQKEQKAVEYLPKRKVYDIMNKLTELSISDLIPVESEEYVKINEITSDVHSLLDYAIEQKPIKIEVYELGKGTTICGQDYKKRDCRQKWNWLESLKNKVVPQPHWKPSEDEERLINTSISFLKDFADKGYENAVECIDWLKSKLNGNPGK